MENNQPSRFHIFLRWVLISGIITSIVGFIILTTVDWVTNENTEVDFEVNNIQNSTEKNIEVKEFLSNYFDNIQNGNYDELLKNYWDEGVADAIVKKCSNPLDETKEDIKNLWLKCGYFTGIKVDIIDIEETDEQYELLVQFTDKDGEIIGIDEHPEYSRGRSLFIYKTDQGLKINQWNFW